MRRSLTSWTKTLESLGFKRKMRKQSKNNRPRRRPSMIESLEPRHMLSITVDTLVDENDVNHTAGDLSLREALAIAADEVNHPGQDTIEFAPELFNNGPATITLAHDGNGDVTADDFLSMPATSSSKVPAPTFSPSMATIKTACSR